MPDQRDIADLGGTMRLGRYDCRLLPETLANAAYATLGYQEVISERHRHRFEFNNAFRGADGAGWFFPGLSPDGRLVEIAELREHPFMLGSQFHPEFRKPPTRPHPLFLSFIKAAARQHQALADPDPVLQSAAPV